MKPTKVAIIGTGSAGLKKAMQALAVAGANVSVVTGMAKESIEEFKRQSQTLQDQLYKEEALKITIPEGYLDTLDNPALYLKPSTNPYNRNKSKYHGKKSKCPRS